jgi:hypothetical protein
MTKKEMMKLARRIARHPAPVHLTTEQLGEAMARTVREMTPVQKALLRRRLRDDKLLAKTAKRLMGQKSVLRTLPCSDKVH